jgi:hypothetical protein
VAECRQLFPPNVIALRQIDNFFDSLIAEDAMMRITALLSEQSEKHEHIAHTNALIDQMRLRCAALAEQALAAICEHRIVVAEIARTQLSPACRRRMVAQTQIAIGGA